MGELVQSHVVRRLLAEAADERGPAQHDRVARHETADELMARGTAIVLVERRRIDEDLGQVGVLPARSPEHEHHRAARDRDADFVGHGGVDAGDLGVVDEDRDVALEARALVRAQRRVVPDVALQRAPPRRGELARGDATPSQRAMQQQPRHTAADRRGRDDHRRERRAELPEQAEDDGGGRRRDGRRQHGVGAMPRDQARSLKRWILPVAVFGSSPTNSIQRGYL